MAQTPPSVPDPRLTHTMSIRQSAIRIKAATDQILLDLAHGRPMRAAGRKVAAEMLALCEAMGALSEAERAAARQRGEMAA
jgi:hypothetical protein